MGQKQTFFQILLLVAFGTMAVGGVLYLAIYDNSDGYVAGDFSVTIWGPPFKDEAVKKILGELVKEEDNSIYANVSYVEKHPATIYSDILESIATGNSPDIVIISSEDLLALKNKILPISFETLPKSSFYEQWVEGSDVFMLEDATYARPFLVDPLVMYWNRDIFTNEAIATPPKDWDTFVAVAPRLSKIISGSELVQSAVAFGEYDNVLHAKEILSALFMQTGARIVDENVRGFTTHIETTRNLNTDTAMSFYTSFSNPVKKVYSWNKTFDRSREAFAADKVAMYMGFISEEDIIANELNPNLNFGMAVLPQSNNTKTSVTFGNFYGIAVLKNGSNPRNANTIAVNLASAAIASRVAEVADLPPVHLDLLSTIDPLDANSKVKLQSAIMSRAWLEPAPRSSVETSFKSAINDVVAGSVTPEMGVNVLGKDIEALLKQYKKN